MWNLTLFGAAMLRADIDTGFCAEVCVGTVSKKEKSADAQGSLIATKVRSEDAEGWIGLANVSTGEAVNKFTLESIWGLLKAGPVVCGARISSKEVVVRRLGPRCKASFDSSDAFDICDESVCISPRSGDFL